MFHNVIYKKQIKPNVYASIDEKSEGHYIFRITDETKPNWHVLAVANVREHNTLSMFECYTEAVKIDEGMIAVFKPLYEFLEFHTTYYQHNMNEDAPLLRYRINKNYTKQGG